MSEVKIKVFEKKISEEIIRVYAIKDLHFEVYHYNLKKLIESYQFTCYDIKNAFIYIDYVLEQEKLTS